MSMNPYLYFDGQCEEAFRFYEKSFGGKITFMMAWKDSRMPGQAPPGWAEKILHAGLAASDGVLEGCDAMPGQYKKPESFCVMLRPKDVAEADRIFKALAEVRSFDRRDPAGAANSLETYFPLFERRATSNDPRHAIAI